MPRRQKLTQPYSAVAVTWKGVELGFRGSFNKKGRKGTNSNITIYYVQKKYQQARIITSDAAVMYTSTRDKARRLVASARPVRGNVQ